MALDIALKILDPRLPGWGFPHYGSDLAAGLDLHACVEEPLLLRPQMPAVLISAGFAIGIADPEWCALVVPRSGLGHRKGLVLGNAVGVIDADYQGPCFVSAWNRNPPRSRRQILIRPGDRIAQLVFIRIARPQLAVLAAGADQIAAAGCDPDRRGARGFGSTGVAAACPGAPTRRNSSISS